MFTPNVGLELRPSSQTPLSFDKISGEMRKAQHRRSQEINATITFRKLESVG